MKSQIDVLYRIDFFEVGGNWIEGLYIETFPNYKKDELIYFKKNNEIIGEYYDSEGIDTSAIAEISSTKTVMKVGEGEGTVENVNFKLKLHSKLHALDKLGEYLKLFKGAGSEEARDKTVIFIVPGFNKDLVINDEEYLKKLQPQNPKIEEGKKE